MNLDGKFALLPESRTDLQEHAKYLGRNNADKAVEFFAAARETFRELADAPFLGSPQFFNDASHHSLRRWPVKGFSQYLIFYRPFASGDGVVIWRVWHHSRDIVPLLEAVVDDVNEAK